MSLALVFVVGFCFGGTIGSWLARSNLSKRLEHIEIHLIRLLTSDRPR